MPNLPRMLRSIFFLASLWIHVGVSAQYLPEQLFLENRTYNSNIQTVQLYPRGEDMAFPIVKLNSGMTLELHFDDLSGDFQNFAYTFIHCDAYWRPSDLMKQEYLRGFELNYISQFALSINTRVPYIHYTLNFPNSDVSFTKSGNYLLVVYQNDDPEDLVLSRRFMVSEEMVGVEMDVHRGSRVDTRDTHHEVDFIIHKNSYEIQNPFTDLAVIVLQNQRWDNAIAGLTPQFINGTQLVYNYEDENVFTGGNEFRFFDTKDLYNALQRVARISTRDSIFQVYITNDFDRSYTRYSTYFDINGHRRIRNQRGEDPLIESDYAEVHFHLNYNEDLTHGDLYLFGALSDWQFLPSHKMQRDERGYSATLLLKQGYYNYTYLFLRDGTYNGETALIEGNYFETENDYYVLVYNRELGQRYDRLIGYQTGSSAPFR